MAKKLAPLVIPAVIDTSGIDRGVNNIRNKLSRVRGQGGSGIGGGGNGFSSGITPYGLPIGNGLASAAAAAMAAAFGASAGQRNTDSFIRWDREGRFNQPAGKGRAWGATNNPAAFNRAFPMLAKTNIFTNFTANASKQLTLAEYKSMRADVRTGARDMLAARNPSINSIADARDALEIAQSRRRDLIRQRRIEPFRRMTNTARENFRGLALEGTAGVGASFYGGLRALEGISPIGIQSTLGNLKPFETRAAGQYDIAQGMRNRAMTATQGNLTMGQQFLLGAGEAAGIGGVTRTEQMGAGLYEGLGTVAAVAGSGLEKTLSAGVGAVEGFLQRAAVGGYLSNPFNYIRRIMN